MARPNLEEIATFMSITGVSEAAAIQKPEHGGNLNEVVDAHFSEGDRNMPKNPERQRFLLELEFLQCLANPTYIHYLAQNRYFEDEAFIGYLKYLQYWQRPEYSKFIMYPHCLYFLELLQNANYRNAMAHPANKELAHRQQFYLWKNYRNNRLKHILPKPLPEEGAALVPSTGGSALSPMQYAIPSGSALTKNDPRSSGVDRRKRK